MDDLSYIYPFVRAVATWTPCPIWSAGGLVKSTCCHLPKRLPILGWVRSGLLGGTFDPPHIAHLLAGEVAFRQLGLDRVIFMPAGSPWQKAGREVSAAQHRWEMSRRAVAGVDYFEADEREVYRDGWTYTADTLDSFGADEELVLILGADAAQRLPSWERSADVLARAKVAVVPRPGVERAEVDEVVRVDRWLEMPSLPVSGTDIRQRVERGLGFRFLVTEGVYQYLDEQNLYRG